MNIPQQYLCANAAKQNSLFWTQAICGVTESIATGNPVYPLFDIRNIKKDCRGWFTCQRSEGFGRFAMNQPEVIKLFQANRDRTGSVRRWRWTECNKWDGWTIKDKLMETQIFPNSSVHWDNMLNLSKEKNFKVLVYVGENDFQMNYLGIEKVIQNLNWEGLAQFNEENPDGTYVGWKFTN